MHSWHFSAFCRGAIPGRVCPLPLLLRWFQCCKNKAQFQERNPQKESSNIKIQPDFKVIACDCTTCFSTQQSLQASLIGAAQHGEEFRWRVCRLWFGWTNPSNLIRGWVQRHEIQHVHETFGKPYLHQNSCRNSGQDSFKPCNFSTTSRFSVVILMEMLENIWANLSKIMCRHCSQNGSRCMISVWQQKSANGFLARAIMYVPLTSC